MNIPIDSKDLCVRTDHWLYPTPSTFFPFDIFPLRHCICSRTLKNTPFTPIAFDRVVLIFPHFGGGLYGMPPLNFHRIFYRIGLNDSPQFIYPLNDHVANHGVVVMASTIVLSVIAPSVRTTTINAYMIHGSLTTSHLSEGMERGWPLEHRLRQRRNALQAYTSIRTIISYSHCKPITKYSVNPASILLSEPLSKPTR